jgi:hypothetical protein
MYVYDFIEPWIVLCRPDYCGELKKEVQHGINPYIHIYDKSNELILSENIYIHTYIEIKPRIADEGSGAGFGFGARMAATCARNASNCCL